MAAKERLRIPPTRSRLSHPDAEDTTLNETWPDGKRGHPTAPDSLKDIDKE